MFKTSFFLNGKLRTAVISPETNALNFLRNVCGLTGTKEGCSEGDCGACTIVVGEVKNGKLNYKAVNSCLMPALSMHGKHIVTIEGTGTPEKLHPIQKALLDFHGVQCGYCTPGIVMSLFGLFINNPNPPQKDIFDALEGNLCRCTGYEAIKNAAYYLSQHSIKNQRNFMPDYFNRINKLLISFNKRIIHIPCHKKINHKYLIPTNTKELLDYLALNKNCKIINGGTDLMVDINIKKLDYKIIIDISQVEELHFVKQNSNSILIGANITLSEILENKVVRKKLPLLCQAISSLGSKQIRNVATMAGNIANASPIADITIVLLSLNAKLILISNNRKRKIRLTDFYRSYKKTSLKPIEIIYAIEIPIRPILTNFLKTAKRKSVDIASVNSAITIIINNQIIKDINIAFGGVAEFPFIVQKTCHFLLGKKLSKSIIDKASCIAESEVRPITDLRGSEVFRRTLVRNHIVKHFNKLFGNTIS